MQNDDKLREYLNIINAFPFVDDVFLEGAHSLFDGQDGQSDGSIVIKADQMPIRFKFAILNFPKYSTINNLINTLEMDGIYTELVILFSPYITQEMAEYLDSKSINYVDLVGNCRFVIGTKYHISKSGKRPPKKEFKLPRISVQGLKLIFSLLADPILIKHSVREIASLAGISKSSAANWLQNLEEEGLLGRTKKSLQIIEKEKLLNRWLEGYKSILLPEIFIGSYMTPFKFPHDLEKQVMRVLNDNGIAFAQGEFTAAWELVRHYRGTHATFHIHKLNQTLLNDIKAVPARDGNLVLMDFVNTISLRGRTSLAVHPLLIYTQLISMNDPRAIETAKIIYEENLGSL
ncbi:MAG: helix-turn-helix domain-containing protein [Deltaproteobacteria bacterium]|nr:helix-turn-helix domain-containing protein [Deltaproteobacteria bacterium]